MAQGPDRRAFFKELLRGAAKTAQEVSSAFQAEADELRGAFSQEEEEPWEHAWDHADDARPAAASLTERTATDEELAALAREVGLEARLDDVRAHARTSLRLVTQPTPVTEPGVSRLGGEPDVPAGFEWPSWRDEALTFVGQVRLEEAAALAPGSPLPERGLLLFFYATSGRPLGLRPEDRGGVRVIHVEDAGSTSRDLGGHLSLNEVAVELGAEVTLPSETAGLPGQLELEVEELDPWQRLRERLADLQGVELEDRAPEFHALHRLLGHPDTLHEGMDAECQLASAGIDLNTGERFLDPRVEELEQHAGDWRLLFQLSADDNLGVSLGYPLGRLYVWIREQDLRERNFDDVWALVR